MTWTAIQLSFKNIPLFEHYFLKAGKKVTESFFLIISMRTSVHFYFLWLKKFFFYT